ncbi:phosphotransferase [Actinomadura luteofluorescens]|uniref:phosphotransferase n=1 Tax=Actinomadura luteofluorescens TaxID=46163 RepID=UPI0021648E5B|nr:phosphotransferase [Actinomadura glauciflava]MCR3745535.1 Ser/Thr protein kinase RdoA involved in Cpx stress response, MazF antagonist [Actinomadura glauciflava]
MDRELNVDDTANPPTGLEALLAREYGLEGAWDRLGSERDDTFRLRVADKAFLVKVSPPAEPFELIDLQISAITHLARTTSLPVPRIHPTLGRAPTTILPAARGDQLARMVHVMRFLPGSDLSSHHMTSGQAQRVGEVHGEVTRALARFHHAHEQRRLVWDLTELPALAEVAEELADHAHRELARRVMRCFERTVMPLTNEFDRQVIHGDFSVYNVLADPSTPGFVTGVVDFGDLHHGPVIFDLAIALSNLLDHRLADPWFVGAQHVTGFLKLRSLPRRHRGTLPVAAVARSLQRALISESRARKDPARAEYVLEHARADWPNIEAGLQTIDIATAHFSSAGSCERRTQSYGESQ